MAKPMDAAETMFEQTLGLIRKAGYDIKSGFWDRRSETELRLLKFGGELHTAQAAMRLIAAGRAVPGLDGETDPDYWPNKAAAAAHALDQAVAATLATGQAR